MNQKCKNGFVKRLRNETRPLHVLLNDQTLACFFPETTTIPSCSDVAYLSGFSGRSNDKFALQNIPILSPESTDNGFATLGNNSSIRHPSAFFLLVLRTSKPASVAMTRWLTQEVLPKTAVYKAPLITVTDDVELKRLIGRHKSRMGGQILVNLEIVKAGEGKPPSSVDEAEILVEGGERCQRI